MIFSSFSACFEEASVARRREHEVLSSRSRWHEWRSSPKAVLEPRITATFCIVTLTNAAIISPRTFPTHDFSATNHGSGGAGEAGPKRVKNEPFKSPGDPDSGPAAYVALAPAYGPPAAPLLLCGVEAFEP